MNPLPVTIGLISDTHMPQRWPALHQGIFDLFSGVDLIFHAGDVGKLWVLDQLSQCAPVIAVHGNDETVEATHALPYMQTLVIRGQRLLLTHSHYPDRAEEMANRQEDVFAPKFDRFVDMAQQHGADIFIFGHWHIPMALRYKNVFLINPGALASGSFATRQLLQSVATLTLGGQNPPQVQHFRLPDLTPFTPIVTPQDRFSAMHGELYESIVDEVLREHFLWLERELLPLAPHLLLDEIYLPLAHQCWSGQVHRLTPQTLAQAIQEHPQIPPQVLQKLAGHEIFGRFLR